MVPSAVARVYPWEQPDPLKHDAAPDAAGAMT